MAKHIQGVVDKIIVSSIKEEKMSEGGIVIPESATKDPQDTCLVISVGEKVTKEITPGSTILCHRAAGQTIMVGRKIYKVLGEQEVYAIVSQDVPSAEIGK